MELDGVVTGRVAVDQGLRIQYPDLFIAASKRKDLRVIGIADDGRHSGNIGAKGGSDHGPDFYRGGSSSGIGNIDSDHPLRARGEEQVLMPTERQGSNRTCITWIES